MSGSLSFSNSFNMIQPPGGLPATPVNAEQRENIKNIHENLILALGEEPSLLKEINEQIAKPWI